MNDFFAVVNASDKFFIRKNNGVDSLPFLGVFINKSYGRFGNNIKQLRNAVRIAQFLGVASVAISDFPEWLPNFKSLNVNNIAYTHVAKADELPSGAWLCSDFFDISMFEKILPEFDELSFSVVVRTILGLNLSRKVAIHFRAGDIFQDNPHSHYVQPPFEYYKKCFEDYIGSNKVDEISLVFEDLGNPVILKFANYLSRLNYKFTMNSADFMQGFSDLKSADCAIFGFGSFSYPVLYSGESIKRVYFPSYEVFGLQLANKLRIDAKFVDVFDYIKIGDWVNSSEQCEILLSHNKCSEPKVFVAKS